MAIGQVAGKIIRAEYGHHAVGMMLQAGLVVAGALLTGADADINLVDHGADFGQGFPVRLAGFEADGAGQSVLLLL